MRKFVKAAVAITVIAAMFAATPTRSDARTEDVVKYGAAALALGALASYASQPSYGYYDYGYSYYPTSSYYYGGYYPQSYSYNYYPSYYTSSYSYWPSSGYYYDYSPGWYGGYGGYYGGYGYRHSPGISFGFYGW